MAVNIGVAGNPLTLVIQFRPLGIKINTITGTAIMKLPINCVVAGQQPGDLKEKKARVLVDLHGIVRKIFGE